LRVLQEGEFERVGSSKPIKVDVRVIAATNRDLGGAVRHATFRSDLFYRLNVFPIEVPPLRERTSDIPLLANFFVTKYAKKLNKQFRGIVRGYDGEAYRLWVAGEHKGVAECDREGSGTLAWFRDRDR
jgi:Transcriptional regulator containing PAS, AAA-type ATPase, and DNA-binding domains